MRRYTWSVVLLVLVGQLYGLLVYGPQIWVDIANYSLWGSQVESWAAFKSFWTQNGNVLGYSTLGLPLLTHLLQGLPDAWVYPPVVLTQRLLVGLGTVYFFLEAYKFRPSYVYLPVLAVFVFFPLFATTQNHILTEAPTMAGLLFGFGALVAMLRQGITARHCITLVCAGLFISLFRLYLIPPLAVGMALIALYRRDLRNLKVYACGLLLVLATVWQPVLKSYAAGYLVTSATIYDVLTIHWMNTEPTPEQCSELNKFPLPPNMDGAFICSDKFFFRELNDLVVFWKAEGMTPREVVTNAEGVASVLKQGVFEKRLLCAVAGSGFPRVQNLVGERTFMRYNGGKVSGQTRALNNLSTYTLFSGLYPEIMRRNNAEHFAQSNPPVKKIYDGFLSWTGFIRPGLIDPLHVGHIPPDWIALLGVLGIVCLLWAAPPLGAAMFGFVLWNGFILFSIPYDDMRYSFSNFIIYFLALTLLAPTIAGRFQSGWGRLSRRNPAECKPDRGTK